MLAPFRASSLSSGSAFVFLILLSSPRLLSGAVPAPGSIDPSFITPNINDTIWSVAYQADGKILIGGYFTNVSGQTRLRLARLESDGTLDSGFVSGVDGWSVDSIALKADGQILVGGPLSISNGVPRQFIARLNINGDVDDTFVQGLSGFFGLSRRVHSIALQNDGKIILGGSFYTNIFSPSYQNIARLQSDGRLDPGFPNPTVGASGFCNQGEIYSIALQSDGKILAGGYFTNMSGQSRGHIARLNADGSLDTNFLNGLTGVCCNPCALVHSIALQGDGKILIAGSFASVNGESRTNVARLNPDGSLDPNYLNSLSGPDDVVNCIVLQPDGKALIGGSFQNVNGERRYHLARLHTNGTLDHSFIGETIDYWDLITAIVLQPDGRVLVVGSFHGINGVSRKNLARLYGDIDPRNVVFVGQQLVPTAELNADTNQPAVRIDPPQRALAESGRVIAREPGFVAITWKGTNSSNIGPVGYWIENGDPPLISQQPSDRQAWVGATAQLDVVASGTQPLHYQWWSFSTGPLTGATNSTLVLTSVQVSDAGFYWVVVTNAAGTAVSVPAMLSVANRPLVLHSTQFVGGVFRFTVDAVPGGGYGVEVSTNLVNWSLLMTTNIATDSFSFSEAQPPNSRMRFYRVLKLP